MSDLRYQMYGFLGRNIVLPILRKKYSKFLSTLKETSFYQESFLLSLIKRSIDTDFGRHHGFSKILTINDFRKAVPIQAYKDLEPYLGRVANGEQTALLSREEHILAFICTTGTTDAPKVIPLTQRWLNYYQKSWQMWCVKSLNDHPNIRAPWLQISGPSSVALANSGLEVGSASALSAKFQNPLFQFLYCTPREIGDLNNAELRQYANSRLSMAQNIKFIITITASNLITLAEVGNTHKEKIIKDIYDGTFYGLEELTSQSLKSKIQAQLKPNRKRASQLEQLSLQHPNLYPKHYWNTELISCWTAGTVGHRCQSLEHYYGNAAVRDIGYISTEGRHTIPLSDGTPLGPLVPDGAFYEFIPLGSNDTFLPHELEIDQEYQILITTSHGLYRYSFDDIVRCRGYIEKTPLIEFMRKTSDFCDLEGEKISAQQVQAAVFEAARKNHVLLQDFSFCGERRVNQPSRYHIYFELSEDTSLNSQALLKLVGDIDQYLIMNNFVYKQKRSDGSLDTLNPVMLAKGSWKRFMMYQANKRKTGETQYKHPVFLSSQQQKELHTLISFSN